MPLYSSLAKIKGVAPGDFLTLFDGTETPADGMKSIPFARGSSPSLDDAGMTFSASGLPATATINVQVANENADTKYTTVDVIAPDANGNGVYTDIGRAAFYRVTMTDAAPSTMPKVKVQR